MNQEVKELHVIQLDDEPNNQATQQFNPMYVLYMMYQPCTWYHQGGYHGLGEWHWRNNKAICQHLYMLLMSNTSQFCFKKMMQAQKETINNRTTAFPNFESGNARVRCNKPSKIHLFIASFFIIT